MPDHSKENVLVASCLPSMPKLQWGNLERGKGNRSSCGEPVSLLCMEWGDPCWFKHVCFRCMETVAMASAGQPLQSNPQRHHGEVEEDLRPVGTRRRQREWRDWEVTGNTDIHMLALKMLGIRSAGSALEHSWRRWSWRLLTRTCQCTQKTDGWWGAVGGTTVHKYSVNIWLVRVILKKKKSSFPPIQGCTSKICRLGRGVVWCTPHRHSGLKLLSHPRVRTATEQKEE